MTQRPLLTAAATRIALGGALLHCVGLAVAASLLSTPLLAQSPLGSGKFDGTIFLDRGAFVQLEAAEKALKAGYQHDFLGKVDRTLAANMGARVRFVPRLGATARVSAENNRGTLFGNDDVAVGAELSVNFGWSNLVSYRPALIGGTQSSRYLAIAADVVEQGGKTYPSLKVLRDELRGTSEAFERELRKAIADSVAAVERETKAKDALNNSAALPEADRTRLRFEYEAALTALAAAATRPKTVEAQRRTALEDAFKKFDLYRRDYSCAHGAFQRDIASQYGSVRTEIEKPLIERFSPPHFPTARFSTLLPPEIPLRCAPSQSPTSSPLTTAQETVRRYVLEGMPAADGRDRAGWDRAMVAAQLQLQKRGPGAVTWDQLDIRLGTARSQYKTLAPDAAFASQVVTSRPVAFSAVLSYSIDFGGSVPGGPAGTAAAQQRLYGSRWPVVLGVSAGAQERNNSGELTKVDLRDVVFTSVDSTSTPGMRTIRTGETTRSIFRGELKEYSAFVANVDLLLAPPSFDNKVAIDLFTRYVSGGGGVDRTFSPGVGAFLTEKGAPRKVKGGILLFWENGRRAKIDLIAGFIF